MKNEAELRNLPYALTCGREKDWAERERGVYTKEVMERELNELFPVEVGLKAIQELRRVAQELKPRV